MRWTLSVFILVLWRIFRVFFTVLLSKLGEKEVKEYLHYLITRRHTISVEKRTRFTVL